MKAKSGNALFMNMDKENIVYITSSEDIMISPGITKSLECLIP